MGSQLRLGFPLLVVLLYLMVPVQASEVSFQTIAYNVSSGYQNAATLVIRDNATWQALWSNLTTMDTPSVVPSPPDFTIQMAIAAMMGPQPSCGSSIHITALSLQDNVLHINVTKVIGNPNSESPCPTNISPFHVVQTQRFDGTTTIQTTSSNNPPSTISPNTTFSLPETALVAGIVGFSIILVKRSRIHKSSRLIPV